MLRLHQAMIRLVTDLVDVVSPPTSPLPSSGSPLKPEAAPQPSLHSTRKEPLNSTRKEPLYSTRKEPLQVATKEVHSHTHQLEDTVRRQQQLHIDRMVAYIDERAAYYIKNRSTPNKEPYPQVDWSKINSHTVKNLPQPSYLPIFGCPQDPGIYPDSPDPKGRVMECLESSTQCFLPDCDHITCIPPQLQSFTTTYHSGSSSSSIQAITKNEDGKIVLQKTYQSVQTTPFGRAAGFQTSLGVVAPPASPIRGYIYTDEGWRLHATPPD